MLQVKPQGYVGWLADMLMLPIMYLLHWNLRETPQRTHRWNNQKFTSRDELEIIKTLPKISFSADPKAKSRWVGKIPRFHLPNQGGWKKFVVLLPINTSEQWFIGWLPTDGDSAGISRIPLSGPVRTTIGDGPISFFAISKSGNPLELICVGEGHIGNAGIFAGIPLR